MLSDLLLEVGNGFSSREIRQVTIQFYKELEYVLELMDARTNRLRYCTVENEQREINSYYDRKHIDVALRDFYTDVRAQFSRVVTRPSSDYKGPKALIHLSGVVEPIVFQGQPSGYGFKKLVE